MEKKYKAQEKLNRRAQRKIDQENGVIPQHIIDQDAEDDSESEDN